LRRPRQPDAIDEAIARGIEEGLRAKEIWECLLRAAEARDDLHLDADGAICVVARSGRIVRRIKPASFPALVSRAKGRNHV
jgi:hypothetical protein